MVHRLVKPWLLVYSVLYGSADYMVDFKILPVRQICGKFWSRRENENNSRSQAVLISKDWHAQIIWAEGYRPSKASSAVCIQTAHWQRGRELAATVARGARGEDFCVYWVCSDEWHLIGRWGDPGEEQCKSKGRICCVGLVWGLWGAMVAWEERGGKWEVDRWWRTGNDLPSGQALCSLDLFRLLLEGSLSVALEVSLFYTKTSRK